MPVVHSCKKQWTNVKMLPDPVFQGAKSGFWKLRLRFQPVFEIMMSTCRSSKHLGIGFHILRYPKQNRILLYAPCQISLRQWWCWEIVGLQCLPLSLPYLLRGSPTPLSPGHHCSTGGSAGLRSNMTGNKTLWCHWGQTMTKSTLLRCSRGFSVPVCLVSG